MTKPYAIVVYPVGSTNEDVVATLGAALGAVKIDHKLIVCGMKDRWVLAGQNSPPYSTTDFLGMIAKIAEFTGHDLGAPDGKV